MVHGLASWAGDDLLSSSRRSRSLEKNTVDDAVFTGAGRNANTAFVRLDDGALDEDVSTNVVGVGCVLDHAVDGTKGRLPGLWVVDADLVGSHHANHGVATGLAVDFD